MSAIKGPFVEYNCVHCPQDDTPWEGPVTVREKLPTDPAKMQRRIEALRNNPKERICARCKLDQGKKRGKL